MSVLLKNAVLELDGRHTVTVSVEGTDVVFSGVTKDTLNSFVTSLKTSDGLEAVETLSKLSGRGQVSEASKERSGYAIRPSHFYFGSGESARDVFPGAKAYGDEILSFFGAKDADEVNKALSRYNLWDWLPRLEERIFDSQAEAEAAARKAYSGPNKGDLQLQVAWEAVPVGEEIASDSIAEAVQHVLEGMPVMEAIGLAATPNAAEQVVFMLIERLKQERKLRVFVELGDGDVKLTYDVPMSVASKDVPTIMRWIGDREFPESFFPYSTDVELPVDIPGKDTSPEFETLIASVTVSYKDRAFYFEVTPIELEEMLWRQRNQSRVLEV